MTVFPSLPNTHSEEHRQGILGEPPELPHPWPPRSLLPSAQVQGHRTTGHQRVEEPANCRNPTIQSDIFL